MSNTFDPDHLRAGLQPLSAALQALTEEGQAYQRFYNLLNLGRDGSVNGRLGRFEVGGYEIVTQLWTPPQPVATLVLVHGFYDHMGLYRHVIEWALELGFAVISCDLPGHGLSSGTRASITDFSEYQVVLDRLFVEAGSLGLPKPWHLCGQSTGGAIVIDHLLNHGDNSPIDGQSILLAPLVRPRGWTMSKVSYYLLRAFVKGIDRRFSENTNTSTFLPFLMADPLQPRRLPTVWVGALARWIQRIESAPRSARSPLIIQGESDMTVDWVHNMTVLNDKFDQPQIFMLHEARHHLANEIPELREQFFAFLTQRMR
ncbi:alpha/beta hydrolase [Pseudomonas sp. NPDC090202]|uniref:alpha/beta hydrolase n=1 Tax=unclassified Pseudomonas TaxID=196821 RepID=UPI0038174719